MSGRPAVAPGLPVLVVGAGAQGLTFALHLASQGRPVVLVEGSAAVGGQARSFHYDGFTFDFGLHAFVTRNERLVQFVSSVLGDELDSFYPCAASRLTGGAIIEDSSQWRLRGARRHFYDLWPGREDEAWNCMIVSRPPHVLYPRSGGFGRLFERMAQLFAERGGRLMLRTSVDPQLFEIQAGRLEAVALNGRRVRVAGCYWTAGARPLSPGAGREPAGFLALYHFLVRGRPRVPYHWVRLYDVDHPLLPRLAYFPAKFSARNAPAGHHGIGAVVPLPAEKGLPARLKPVLRWCRERPEDFASLVQGHLARSGLLRDADVIGVRTELLPLPPKDARRRRHRFAGVANFWDCDDWKLDDPRESGVPLQMAAALRAAEEWTASPSVQPRSSLRTRRPTPALFR